MLVRPQRILDQRRELRGQHRAHCPEKADREDGEEQPPDMQRRTDQRDRGADDVPVHRERRRIWIGWGRGDHAADPAPDQCDHNHRDCRARDVKAVGVLINQHAAKQRPAKDRDIGSGLDQSGPAQHFAVIEMLREHGIFDRPEKGRMNPHRRQRDQQQQHIVEQKPGGAEDHDRDLRGLDDADDARFVVRIGQLPGQCRQQEKGQDEQPAGDRAEHRFLLGIAENPIDDEQHHRRAKQVVVERAEELRCEQGQESARFQQV